MAKRTETCSCRSRRIRSEMALPLFRTIRKDICLYRQFLASSYFTTARIVMNNKSATVDDTLAKNPFYEKYASKITTLQQLVELLNATIIIMLVFLI